MRQRFAARRRSRSLNLSIVVLIVLHNLCNFLNFFHHNRTACRKVSHLPVRNTPESGIYRTVVDKTLNMPVTGDQQSCAFGKEFFF
jgi:hypothetical protein